MKHSQYKHWILDDITLPIEQKRLLAQHLTACDECRQLKHGWDASRELLVSSAMAVPAHGFTSRWQETYQRKCRLEKVRRYRITLAGLLLLAFIASLTYMVASGSFLHILANFFTSLTQLILAVTRGLTYLGYWLGRLPVVVPLVGGFLFIGVITSFTMTALFALWNIQNRKKLAYETVSR